MACSCEIGFRFRRGGDQVLVSLPGRPARRLPVDAYIPLVTLEWMRVVTGGGVDYSR